MTVESIRGTEEKSKGTSSRRVLSQHVRKSSLADLGGFETD